MLDILASHNQQSGEPSPLLLQAYRALFVCEDTPPTAQFLLG